MRRFVLAVAAAALSVSGGPSRAEAGPPLICWPIEIGDAKSLPWNGGAFSAKPEYEVGRLSEDTLALLGPSTPVLVRMETLRRATVYAFGSDRGERARAAGWELVARLMGRALDGDATGGSAALAWFDAGYLVGACGQMREHTGFDGYRWALRGRALRDGDDAEMEFALALMRAMGEPEKLRASYEAHVSAALAGAKEGSLLAKNIETHIGHGKTGIEELRARYGRSGGQSDR